jgi:hypothetical protein
MGVILARPIVLIPHLFRLADMIIFRKNYLPPSSLPSRPYRGCYGHDRSQRWLPSSNWGRGEANRPTSDDQKARRSSSELVVMAKQSKVGAFHSTSYVARCVGYQRSLTVGSHHVGRPELAGSPPARWSGELDATSGPRGFSSSFI